MISLATLKETAEAGLRYIKRQKDVREAEIFVADNATLSSRLNYTSHIPCNGVEEPKSTESYGLSVRAVFFHLKEQRIGMGGRKIPSGRSSR